MAFHLQRLSYAPGAERKLRAILANGWPAASIAVHHTIGSETLVKGSTDSQSVTGFPDTGLAPRLLSLAKYLFLVSEVTCQNQLREKRNRAYHEPPIQWKTQWQQTAPADSS